MTTPHRLSLCVLPDELLLDILFRLTNRGLFNVSHTCLRLYALSHERSLHLPYLPLEYRLPLKPASKERENGIIRAARFKVYISLFVAACELGNMHAAHAYVLEYHIFDYWAVTAVTVLYVDRHHAPRKREFTVSAAPKVREVARRKFVPVDVASWEFQMRERMDRPA